MSKQHRSYFRQSIIQIVFFHFIIYKIYYFATFKSWNPIHFLQALELHLQHRIFQLDQLKKKRFFFWNNIFFKILWKSRCHILVTFPVHLKKLRSKLRFWLQKLNYGYFHSFYSWKNTTKQLFLSKFQYRKWIFGGKFRLQDLTETS